MKTENKLDVLYEENMLNFILGSLISADTIYDLDSALHAQSALNKLEEYLPTSKHKDEIESTFNSCKDILKNDIKHFKSIKNENNR
jgi:hypothetical protein